MGSRRCLLAATAALLGCGLLSAPAATALPSTTVSYTQGGILEITGGWEDNRLTVSLAGGKFRVQESGSNFVSPSSGAIGCMNTDPKTVECVQDPPDPPPPAAPNAKISSLSVFLGDGNDSLTNLTSLGTPVLESPQNDLHIDGGNGNDAIRGGSAAETITGGLGQDFVDAGAGDDKLFASNASFEISDEIDIELRMARDEADGIGDVYVGGPGDDVARFDAREDNLTITLDGVANDGGTNEKDNVQTESVVTGSGHDAITGDGLQNTLVGNAGADVLSGLGGADLLDGGRNNDSLIGGRARDQLNCSSGFDLAIARPIDELSKDCERTGAALGSDTGRVRSSASRVWIACPSNEGARCTGKVTLKLDGRSLGKSRFKVKRGKVKAFGVALNGRGRAVMHRRRSILVSANIRTAEPLGQTLKREQLLLTR
jgi:hypothetical protein